MVIFTGTLTNPAHGILRSVGREVSGSQIWCSTAGGLQSCLQDCGSLNLMSSLVEPN